MAARLKPCRDAEKGRKSGCAGRAACPARGIPPPLPPGVFLEVLILNGFQLHFSEVLILNDLLSPVLILLDFKSLIISDLIKNEDFMEVLILIGLRRD